jgi:alkylation response protein AidB-like acyl-CoA dehydrogenase
VGGGSPYVSGPPFRFGGSSGDPLIALARKTGRLDDARTRDLIGEAATLNRAGVELQRRLAEGMGAGVFPDTTAAIARMMSSVVSGRNVNISLELAGSGAAAANEGDIGSTAGMSFLMRQAGSIGGGTTEMARNNVSERVLGMPREMTHDRNLAFRDVPKGPPSN